MASFRGKVDGKQPGKDFFFGFYNLPGTQMGPLVLLEKCLVLGGLTFKK